MRSSFQPSAWSLILRGLQPNNSQESALVESHHIKREGPRGGYWRPLGDSQGGGRGGLWGSASVTELTTARRIWLIR